MLQHPTGTNSMCIPQPMPPCLDPAKPYYNIVLHACQSRCAYPYTVQDRLHCILDLSPIQAQQVQAMTTASIAVTVTTSTVAALVISTNPEDPCFFLLTSMINMIQAVRYINVTYSPEVQALFSANSILNNLIAILPTINNPVSLQFTDQPLPENFANYHLSSSFLANNWTSSATLSLLLLTILIRHCFTTKTNKGHFTYRVCAKIKANLQWNFFLSQIISCYGDIILFGSFGFRNITGSAASGLDILSQVVCMVMNIVALIVFVQVVHVVMKTCRSTSHHSDNDPQQPRLKQCSMVFAAYKNSSWLQQSFVPIYIVRVCIFYFVISYLITYPLMQGIIISTVSVCIVLYMVVKRPVKNRGDQWQYTLQEVVLLVVNVCVTILAALDTTQIDTDTVDKNMKVGRVILWSNAAFQILMALCSVANIAIQIKALYLGLQKWLEARKKKHLAVSPLSVPQRDSSLTRSRHEDLSAQNSFNQSYLSHTNNSFAQARMLMSPEIRSTRDQVHKSSMPKPRAEHFNDPEEIHFRRPDDRRPPTLRIEIKAYAITSGSTRKRRNAALDLQRDIMDLQRDVIDENPHVRAYSNVRHNQITGHFQD